jgi:hypothetical protein
LIDHKEQKEKGSLKGSITVEMTYVLPVIFLVFLSIVWTAMYYYDRSCLQRIASEIAITGALNQRESIEENLKTQCEERARSRLLMLELDHVEVNLYRSYVEVVIGAQKNWMDVTVRQQVPIMIPEDSIRKMKQWESKEA